MKIIFFGTPEIAVPFLEFLHQKEEIIAVVTQVDKTAGRGRSQLHLSPVKLFAQEKRLSIFQPRKINELLDSLSKLTYDLGIVVAYGKILPLSLIKIAKLGYLNVHFSLLPKYRGAAPVQWAIINGEKETGVTIFWLDEGLDSGKIIRQKKIAIKNTDTVNTLLERLIPLGIETLRETLQLIKENPFIGEPQVGEPSYAPTLKKGDGKIDWTKEAKQIYNLIRGTQPWPGVYTALKTKKNKVKSLKIIEAKPISSELINLSTYEPGTIVGLEKNNGFIVKCKRGNHLNSFLLIKKIQEEGKKVISAWDWWQGARLKIGDCLG